MPFRAMRIEHVERNGDCGWRAILLNHNQGNNIGGFDHVNRPARYGRLAGTYPDNPIILDQRPGALSDRNSGATLIRARPCIHIFSIEFA